LDQAKTVKLRSVMLEILDEFVRICDKNKFSYFLAYGTLLGAVRHKGFIPWDDDIDVGMPRNDYERFLDIFQKNTETNYYVYNYVDYAKLCKKGTVYAESHLNPKDYWGIFIDIWPFDNCVSLFLPIQIRLIAIAKKLYRLKTKKDIPQKKIKRFINKLICFLLPLQFIRVLRRETIFLFNKFTTKNISSFAGIYDYKKENHKYNTIFPVTNIHFEGKYYKAPGKWDIYLSKLYGNYMELPPVEQRINHNPKFILFDNNDIINENIIS
jgi:lipopolysaccharide cholinephosphotransferase